MNVANMHFIACIYLNIILSLFVFQEKTVVRYKTVLCDLRIFFLFSGLKLDFPDSFLAANWYLFSI